MGQKLEVANSKRVRAVRSTVDSMGGGRQFSRASPIESFVTSSRVTTGTDVVVTYGAASFNCKGIHPGRVKTLRSEVEKRVGIGTGPSGGGGAASGEEVNEDYTSKVCSKCHEVLTPMLDERRGIFNSVRVRYCSTTSCFAPGLPVKSCRERLSQATSGTSSSTRTRTTASDQIYSRGPTTALPRSLNPQQFFVVCLYNLFGGKCHDRQASKA